MLGYASGIGRDYEWLLPVATFSGPGVERSQDRIIHKDPTPLADPSHALQDVRQGVGESRRNVDSGPQAEAEHNVDQEYPQKE